MSIQKQIARLNGAKEQIEAAIKMYGVTVPSDAVLDNLADKCLAIAAAATNVMTLHTVTVPASGWESGNYSVTWDDTTTDSYPQRCRVAVDGMTAGSSVAVSQRTRVTEAVCLVTALESGDGYIDFYADTAPGEDAVFVIEEVRYDR